MRPRTAGARALDLACGIGRNALYLADLGYQVDAWDASDVGLDLLRHELAARAQTGPPPRVSPRLVDLDNARLPVGEYDLVLVFNFLQRGLFSQMTTALKAGGWLAMRALMQRRANDDRNAAYLLQPDELRAAFSGLTIVEHEEDATDGWASVIARRDA